MNIKQRDKNRIAWQLFIHCRSFIDFKGVTEGLVMEERKNKTKQRKGKECKKKVLGKLNGTRSITLDLFNCLI
jgi:hypothetical protein